MTSENKSYLIQSLVGFIVGVAICALLTLLAGCKTASHTEKEYILKTDTVVNTVTQHITDTRTDTLYITQVKTDTLWQTLTQTTVTRDLWDNLITTWTDSLGRTVTQRHETGSRVTTDSTSQTTIRALRDSLSLANTEYMALENDYALLQAQYSQLEAASVTHDSKSESKSTPLWPYLLWILPFSLLAFLYFYLKKTKS